MQHLLENIFVDLVILWGVIVFAVVFRFVFNAIKEITERKQK